MQGSDNHWSKKIGSMEHYDKISKSYDEQYGEEQMEKIRTATKMVGKLRSGVVLDLGSGTGQTVKFFRALKFDAYGLDWIKPRTKYCKKANITLTDSGGIQEEAPSLGKPVLVLRKVSERPEAIEAGAAKVVGTDTKSIVEEALLLLEDEREYSKMANASNPFGDGHAAERIVKIILEEL